MEHYGEAYKRELERAKVEAETPKHALKPIFDVNTTFYRFQEIIQELQEAGAPVFCSTAEQIAPLTYMLTMTIGTADFDVVFFNDSIKVFWRGRENIPMIYDALSASRLNALARTIIDRAVNSALNSETKPQRSRVFKIARFSKT